MTDEMTATLVATDTEPDSAIAIDDLDAAPPVYDEPVPTLSDAFPDLAASGNGMTPPHLRTAWKRKHDRTKVLPGKPSAKPALARSPERPEHRAAHIHAPWPDDVPKAALAAPPLPKPAPAPPHPPAVAPSALRPMAPRAAVFYPSTHGVSPKAKTRHGGRNVGQPPSGIVRAGPGQAPRWPGIQKWLGTALIVVGVLIAVGALGGNYLMQRHTEQENEAFTASLSQFGPTPTPLTARATMIAARSAGTRVPGSAAPVAVLPAPMGGVTAVPTATNDMAPRPTAAAVTPAPSMVPPVTARPSGQGAPAVAPGGPPPIVAGGGPRPLLPPAMAPQSGDRTAPIAPVMPTPQPMPQPMLPPSATPVPMPMPAAAPAPDDTTMPTATDSGDAPMVTMEPEPTPTPEPPPRMPLPTHVTIPAIGVNSNIIEVGVSPTEIDGQQVYIWDVAAYAVGHNFSSANPGEGDNVVLSGHDDWQGEVFRDLYKLKKGDKITVQAGDRLWQYHVDTVLLLQEVGVPLEQRLNNALYIGGTGDERLTLITCWPYGIDDHRLVVIAYPDDAANG